MELAFTNLLGFRSNSHNDIHMPNVDQYQHIKSTTLPVELTLKWTLGTFKVKPVRQARQGAIIDDVMTDD